MPASPLLTRIGCGVLAGTLVGGLLFTARPVPRGEASASSGHSARAKAVPTVEPGEAYGKLPVAFEANQGQVDPSVRFIAHGTGYTLSLTDSDAVLTIRGALRQGTVRLQPKGMNHPAQLLGKDLLPGKVNYFIGNDPTRWRTDIPTYSEVVYRNLYPGIDMVYHGANGALEQDFLVAPGADPGPIALGVSGAKSLGLDARGDLLVQLSEGPIRIERPRLYQDSAGSRHEVTGGFRLLGGNIVGFGIGPYDHSRQLLIDPVLAYSTYLGGSGRDFARGIAVDAAGQAYLAGFTESTDFPIKAPYQGVPGVGSHSQAFVTKFNASGSALVYSTYLGGSNFDAASGLAVDALGDVYLGGTTASADFPTTTGAFQRTLLSINTGTYGNAFVTKLNQAGNALVYSTYLGGTGADGANGIAVDGSGNAYVAGGTTSSDFPTSLGAFQSNLRGAGNAFVAELNPTGTALVYATYLGGSGRDEAHGISLDASGNAYVVGTTGSTDFPAVGPALSTYSATGQCVSFDVLTICQTAFVAKINPTATALVYSSFLGGDHGDSGYGIVVDATGSAFLTGATSSTNFPITPGAIQTALVGAGAAFVTRLNPTGGLAFSTFLGGSVGNPGSGDYGSSITVDALGDAYVTGKTYSSSFPIRSPIQAAAGGGGDAFVAKVNPAGNALLFSTLLGGPTTESGTGIAVDSANSIYVAGTVSSGNDINWYSPSLPPGFPITHGAFQTDFGPGLQRAFIAKLMEVPGAVAANSYHLDSADDGMSWVEIDPQLEVTKAPVSSATALITANIDLWTAQAGYNQDVGIFVSTDSGPDTLAAWKESGGFAGTFSPNAALVVAAVPVLAGHSYVFKMKWKPNKTAPQSTLFAAAGTATSQFSPTRFTVRLVPPSLLSTAVQSKSYHLDTANDGGFSSWVVVDPALDVAVPGTESTVQVGANMDLWTGVAGYNQDLGLFVSVDGSTDTLLAWKESGGFAGTFSPNAAFVLATYPTHVGHSYTFRLKWKPNKPAPGGTIYGAAGTSTTQFSPTTLMVEQLAAGTFQAASSRNSYHIDVASRGDFSSWMEVDPSDRVSLTPTAASPAVITGNIDLWTQAAGYNQDIAIFSCDWTNLDCSQFGNYVMIGWKESGGYAGTFSPNAATVQAMLSLTAGHAYTFTLGWKANKPAPAGVIYAGAGTADTQFSPTTLVVQLGG